ncbi:zinc ribbon domain-containing protein [Fusibacter paucivorans]|uniref:Zinc ribbon domain-containing protein n=1 Tax=Fusibacter paucivorans TaxID=76009 RepID=A0ABS5PTA4_9FIRM|nr:zinc ribbon domain-containing protein [Fusibacter paucivorans]MBS7528311.1 zinc ribbon domain-containing protein [Fusibacter paucivorans]
MHKLGWGQKLTILSVLLMTILLIGSFLNNEAELASSFLTYGYLDDIAAYMDPSDVMQLRLSTMALKLNARRFIFLLPVLYPVVSLFKNRHNRKLSLISASLEVVLVLCFLFAGRGLLTFKAVLLLMTSALLFVGVFVTKPKIKTENYSTKYCPHCGEANAVSAKFCFKCGKTI